MCDYESDLSLRLKTSISFTLALLDLPSDVIVILFDYLDLASLFNLSFTCKSLHDLIDKFGWASYLRSNRRFSWSLFCTESDWTPYDRLRYDTQAERNWKSRKFVARPLSKPWRGKLLPILAISKTRLVVAAGSKLYVYQFINSGPSTVSPAVRPEAEHTINRTDAEPEARHDITGIAFLPDAGRDCTLLAGFADGYVMRVEIPEYSSKSIVSFGEGSDSTAYALNFSTLYRDSDVIESLCAAGNFSLTLSGSGKATFQDVVSGLKSEMQLDGRGWSTHISIARSPFTAFGTTSSTPLTIHPITEAALSETPSLVLSSLKRGQSVEGGDREASAVYGITDTPPSGPFAPGQSLAAGWFDGFVRLYDLRAPSSSTTTIRRPTEADAGRPLSVPLLKPVMSVYDPWSTEPIYAVATGGGTGNTIAAGSARHSVVAFWDVRNPRDGWSVHAPGNDSSPVYSVVLESSRVFGATQSRPFVCDFGSGVNKETYPSVMHSGARLDANLKSDDGIHYHITKYLHKRPMAST